MKFYTKLLGLPLKFIVDYEAQDYYKVYTKAPLTCLRLTNIKLGLLIKFGQDSIKDGIHSVVKGL